MSTDPYDRPITAHGQRGGVPVDVAKQRAYFNSYDHEEEDDVDIDYPSYGQQQIQPYGGPENYSYGHEPGLAMNHGRNTGGYWLIDLIVFTAHHSMA